MGKVKKNMEFSSRAIGCIPNLGVFLEDAPEAIVGWGRKASAERAEKRAAHEQLPVLLLEDGFLRSVEREDPPSSLVLDDLGIYYDGNVPSRLEKLILTPLDEAQATRAKALILNWRGSKISKYNGTREYAGELPDHYVLVCDQVFGDSSVKYGLADEKSFARMLDAALVENPDCVVIVKTHPDRFTRGRRSYFNLKTLAKNSRVKVIAEACHPVRLIANAQAVYTVTSQLGMEALIWDKPVRTFGMPFYAGWGLTEDELPPSVRRGRASLEQLVHAALIAYPRYVDPETGERCEVERLLSYLAFQRTARDRFPKDIYAIGFSRWKRPFLRRFLAGSTVHFVRHGHSVPSGAIIAVWGSRTPSSLSQDHTILRIEDGFLRSVGLGADLVAPVSWVCDDKGIYYDATRPSRLEYILAEELFNEEILVRAARLRKAISNANLTKYNLKSKKSGMIWKRPANGKKILLVPGQVEDDASIRFGAPGIRTNYELLKAVRQSNPDAHIVYKPHPDVVAGLRKKGKNEDNVCNFYDDIVVHANMAQLLKEIDEVHTLTSLTGFEALIRGIPVTCYGLPFYAGWGLTTDKVSIARRKRQLKLDELIAGALILYPTYVSRQTGRFSTPEQIVKELVNWREMESTISPSWRFMLRPILRVGKDLVSYKFSKKTATQMETCNGGE